MEEIISVEHLSKQFEDIRAVDDLSFSVKRGEVYGFLGQNGAGKSTTIRMLLTLVQPTAGSVRIFDQNITHHRREVLRKVGAIIEKPDLYKYLTAYQNLKIMSQLSGIRATGKELMNQLDMVGIAERAHSKVKTFSQGMKQRLGLACALIHGPELIVLDEPTNGLDPQGIADIRNLILHLSRNEGKTVFVSSHLLSEIELIADSMLIIDKGRKVVEGKASHLLNPADTLVKIVTADDVFCRQLLERSPWQSRITDSEGIVLKMHQNEIAALTRYLVEHKIDLVAVQPKHSLEDYFFSLTTSNQHVETYKN